jgi:TRAP-type C4-dicarboxylate transport system substrate-binding protein
MGSSPTPINVSELYSALQTHIVEAEENALINIEQSKLYEVQKYVSLTNHGWSGFNLLANWKLWQRFPSDVQQIIERNAAKYVRLQRAEQSALDAELRTKLATQGMTFNEADTSSFRPRLAAYYARWKDTVGARAWSLLEGHVGKLG